MPYFSERELGARPRTVQEVTPGAWKGIATAILARIQDGSFGDSYGEQCSDGRGVTGTDAHLMLDAVESYFPGLSWPLNSAEVPNGFTALDLVEFAYEKVAAPLTNSHHSFFGHDHLSFDLEAGRKSFREEINKVFARNGLAFNLEENGQVIRLTPLVLHEALVSSVFNTSDTALDELLEAARKKFLSHDPVVRQEAIERLWDAFERLKTLVDSDKKASIKILLDSVSAEPHFRQLLEDESSALTRIGNDFMIRHTEVNKIPIASQEELDYLFHRLFALIRLILRSLGLGG